MSNKNHLIVEKTATYFTIGNPDTAKNIFIVIHGYGMLAEYFIKKFEVLNDGDTCVIAPEGLSKFYTQGFYGRVGASWMTKEDRETEIKDYINYLNRLYTEVIKDNTKVNIIGFSQGGATVSRWIADNKVRIDNFILWSSIFPEDMNFKTFGRNFKSYIVFGTHDEFAKPEHFTQQKKLLANNNIKVQIIEFEGPHDIPKDVLLELSEKNNWI